MQIDMTMTFINIVTLFSMIVTVIVAFIKLQEKTNAIDKKLDEIKEELKQSIKDYHKLNEEFV